MIEKWVNCFLISSGVLRGEHIYRVRRHDGTVVEGYCSRQDAVPVWNRILQRSSKKKNRNELKVTWGYLKVAILEVGSEKTLVGLPDDQVVLVKNRRVHDKLPELTANAFDS